MTRLGSVADLDNLRREIISSRDPDRPTLVVCGGTGCRANNSVALFERFRSELETRGLSERVNLKMSGCHGFCQQGPVVVFEPEGFFYREVGLGDLDADVRDIVETTLVKGRPVERLLYVDPDTGEKVTHYREIAFYAKQMRIALRNNGKIDPNSIEDFIAVDGYGALARALSMDPEEVIDWIKKSGLRGRGGGGFPTGLKWGFCRGAADRSVRYIICNADEGDPGAFMDRSIMEGDPHSVLEGMAIGAYAMSRGISPAEGYIYIRAEYPLAVENVRIAIAQAEELGVLGDDILGTGFDFHVKVKEGAGAFVCGEETALLASVEGRRGMPRTRPPFPAHKGLHGKPTNINNVETWANIPRIIGNGPEWYAGIGTAKSTGTKVFSLVGKVKNCGLVEVPMGMTLGEIIFDIGGGTPDGKRFKAVQTGGPSGGCLPTNKLSLEVDYETLAEAGSIMGSGGMVVMDEDTCMVDVAKYFIDFTQSESCGKCVPCRLGTKQMLGILNRISAGEGCEGDIKLLEEIAGAVKEGSLCGLGQTAPNPVLTTIRYFRDEYEAHIKLGKCDAAVCHGLVGAPCKHTCPAGVDVPRYIRCIVAGKYREAADVVRERLPFPAVCGRICYHPCETKCRRLQLDDGIAVRALKRFAVERGTRKRQRRPARRPPTGRKVAVVGAGPAGLTAAYYLARLGHGVTVFEKDAEVGGTLRSGIPAFRLPREVIDADVREIKKAGVRIRTNSPVKSIGRLFKRGYDAVLLAHGAGEGMKMGIPGADSPRVFDLITFLRQANSGTTLDVGKRAVVIGGGSSAMDAARMAVRLGADQVTVLYRRSRKEMPAADEEVAEAREEGVTFEFLAAPTEIVENGENADSRLTMKCVRMELGPIDSSGRRRPTPIEGGEFEMKADTVVMAIGQRPEEIAELGCDLNRSGCVRVDEMTLESSRPGVFAAGDVVVGPASVIEAIGAARRVAASIDRYLGGDGNIDGAVRAVEEPVIGELPEEEGERRRPAIASRPARERIADFGEVELGFEEAAALEEAARCLRCDLEEYED